MLARAALSLPGYERQLRDLLAAIRPEIVHTNGFKAHVLSCLVLASRRAQRCGTCTSTLLSQRPLTRRLIRHDADRCSLIVANSESVGADVRTITGKRAPLRVIYNAVDLQRFSPRERWQIWMRSPGSCLRPPRGPWSVGLIATFSRWKGHDTFLRAVASLPASVRIRPYIVGGALYDTAGSQDPAIELRRLAATYGLADRVGFTGFIESADRAMRALDIVVHASTSPEPFELVIAETMACGRALVTSATGGAAELVRPGQDAVTHRPGTCR